MMRQFFSLLLAVGVILAMAAMACVSSGGLPVTTSPVATQKVYSQELYAIADAASAQETAIAQETRTALESIAKATSDALALEQQATRQSQDALATSQAQAAFVEQTRVAMDAQATTEAYHPTATAEAARATSTAESHSLTATATREMATATSQAIRDSLVATQVNATAQAITRRNDIAESRQVMTTWAGYGVLVLFLAGVAFIGYMLLPTIAARIGAIPRDARGDPPLVFVAPRGALGSLALFDPTKLWGGATVINGDVKQPLLTDPQLQNNQSKRADFVNMSKGGRPRPVIAMPRTVAPTPQVEPWRVEQSQEDTPANWPARVNLVDVFADRTPSLNHLVIGVYPQPDSSLAVVGESLHKLMHILCCGSSGWGKSTFLSSFVWQLAQCREPVSVVAIDISGSEFNLLREWNKLQFPVARSDKDAIATLQAVADELARRRELFEQFPTARNLARYNRMSGDNLDPWVILLDEGASLLARRDTGDTLRNAIQTSRQYGLYCLLSSVSVNHRVLETQTRDQFSTRLAFRLPKSSMRIVLDETPPEEPARPGRAWARLAGREMVQIQAPIIGEQELVATLQPGGPVEELPETAEERDPREQRVLDLLESDPKLSDTAAARIVYGHGTTHYIEKVRAIKAQQQHKNDNNNGENKV